ncbi:MAG: hypothetical protein IH940_09240 [Acidobacteria bacterium]|nr:hypothetical protein [Acidobacteriota bacterium]
MSDTEGVANSQRELVLWFTERLVSFVVALGMEVLDMVPPPLGVDVADHLLESQTSLELDSVATMHAFDGGAGLDQSRDRSRLPRLARGGLCFGLRCRLGSHSVFIGADPTILRKAFEPIAKRPV